MSQTVSKVSSPFFHQSISTRNVMLLVCVAMLPGIAAQFYFFGVSVIINILLSISFALLSEAFILHLRKRDIIAGLSDNSALLTGLILGVALPPLIPFWMLFVGVSFAIIFAKQIYGGLGNNPFNPAMVGYVLLLISFPVEMTAWLPASTLTEHHPTLLQCLQITFYGKTSGGLTLNHFREIVDGFTMATPLDHFKTSRSLGLMLSEVQAETNYNANLLPAIMINLAYLAGGLFLLWPGIIRWHIPVAMLAGMLLCGFVIHLFDAELYMPPWLHLVTGSAMIGVFFIATDPVSAATTPKGRLIYGALIGILVVLIRSFGGYPDAIAFAVLLLNIAAPTIDHYSQPKIYGEQSK